MTNGVAADFARVDFDGIFAGRYQFEMFADHAEDTFDLFVAQKGRRAAAEVQLGKLVPSVQMWSEQFHFFFKIFDVGIGAAFVFGDDFVAAAVVADGVAKRNVNVKGKRFV